MAASDEEENERCMETYREEKKRVKGCVCKSKGKVGEQFGRKMNGDVNGNRKLFCKVSNVKGGKVRVAGE